MKASRLTGRAGCEGLNRSSGRGHVGAVVGVGAGVPVPALCCVGLRTLCWTARRNGVPAVVWGWRLDVSVVLLRLRPRWVLLSLFLPWWPLLLLSLLMSLLL